MGSLEESRVKALLNNTVLSNFASVGRLDLLQRAVEEQAATTPQVIEELQQGVQLGRLPAVEGLRLVVVELTGEEEALVELLRQRFGAGEASCIAVAQKRQLRLVTDDGDARRYAAQMGIPLSGTIGILVDLIRTQALSPDTDNALLKEMIQRGFRSPVTDLKTLL